MPVIHYVRVGILGHIGRFASATQGPIARGHRVICQTSRGLEVGQVLRPDAADPRDSSVDGSLLRRVTVDDDLVLERLERHRSEAYAACVDRLHKRGLNATLVDVEHLFDGKSLYFYFLGDITPEIERLTDELAEIYAARIQFRRFSAALTEGCGAGCGTAAATGCASSGCSHCSLAAACRSR